METASKPSTKAVSREELLRKWQEERRVAKQKTRGSSCPPTSSYQTVHCQPNKSSYRRSSKPSPLPPLPSSSSPSQKKIKVRVRRSSQTPKTPAAVRRLYEQGTVAWRLKSKNNHAAESKVSSTNNDYPQPSSLPKERIHHLQPLHDEPVVVRRKSEPYQHAAAVLQERSTNLPLTKSETKVSPDNSLLKPQAPRREINVVILSQEDENVPVSPLSSRSSTFGSPFQATHVSHHRRRPQHYPDENDENHMKENSICPSLSPIQQHQHSTSPEFLHVTSRSRSQRSTSVARSLSYEETEAGDIDHSISSSSNGDLKDLNGFELVQQSTLSPKHTANERLDGSGPESYREGKDVELSAENLENTPALRQENDIERGEALPEEHEKVQVAQQSQDSSPPFDWLDNLSPDEALHGYRRRPKNRRRDFLTQISSPLDSFHKNSLAIREPPSGSPSSLDSEIQDYDQSPVPQGYKGSASDQSSDIVSDTDTAGREHIEQEQEENSLDTMVIPNTHITVEGKTVLQPIRETPLLQSNAHTASEESTIECNCQCCSLRNKIVKEMMAQVEEMKWRIDHSEIERQKYSNQLYAIRKKYESRITPFRDVFEEMAKLRRQNQSLLKDNRESKAALECSVAALQKQMAEALTTAMTQNAELKDKLKEAESQLQMLGSSNGEQSCGGGA